MKSLDSKANTQAGLTAKTLLEARSTISVPYSVPYFAFTAARKPSKGASLGEAPSLALHDYGFERIVGGHSAAGPLGQVARLAGAVGAAEAESVVMPDRPDRHEVGSP